MKPKDVDSTLRALADRARAEEVDPEDASDADRRALLDPLGPAPRKRVMDLALAELCEDPAPSARAGAPANDGAPAPARGRLGPVFTVFALAAAIALFFAVRGDRNAPLAALPAYELTVAGGAADTRGEPSATTVLAPGARVALMLRPGTRAVGPVEARAHLVRDGRARALSLDATVTPEGAIRLSGVLGELPEPPGPAELVVTIVRPGSAHDPLGGASADAQIVRRPVVLAKGGE